MDDSGSDGGVREGKGGVREGGREGEVRVGMREGEGGKEEGCEGG